MKMSLTIAAAVAALAVATHAFAAGPTPVSGSPAPAATTAPSAGTTAAAPAATTAPAAKQPASGSPSTTSSKLDAMTCVDYQKRVDEAIAGSKDMAKIAQAKKDREEGAKLCSSGKHEEGVKHFQTALKDLGVSKTQ